MTEITYAGDNMDQKKTIQAALVRQLFSTNNAALITTVILAAILAYTQSNVIDHSVVLAWFSLIVLFVLFRMAFVIAYQHSAASDKTATHTWLAWVRLGVLATGATWGSSSILLFPVNHQEYQIFLVCMLVGLTAGGLVTYATDLVSAIIFNVSVLVPLIIRLAVTGSNINLAMSASLILYLGFLIISLRYLNRNVCENISLRLEADAREKIVRISEQRYRLLLNHSPVGIFHYDTDFVITYCNDRFADIMRNTVEHITGMDMKMLTDQSIMPAMKMALEGELGHYEGHYLATFSEVDRWVSMICAPSRDDTGKVVGGVAIIQDITERKIMEKQLAHQVQVHALAGERQRIMQDMHDGFGSQLISSLIMVEHGRAGQAEIAQLLRECIDDLRLTIDALTPGEDEEHTDLMAALGTLRQRMEPRLHSAGIVLNWQLDCTGDMLKVASRTALQVLRIVQEALCNVLKHAGATAIQVVVAADNAVIDISVTDNGKGFDNSAHTHGRGIVNMRKRMHELGGALDLSSSGAGTRLHLCLPHLAPTPD